MFQDGTRSTGSLENSSAPKQCDTGEKARFRTILGVHKSENKLNHPIETLAGLVFSLSLGFRITGMPIAILSSVDSSFGFNSNLNKVELVI